MLRCPFLLEEGVCEFSMQAQHAVESERLEWITALVSCSYERAAIAHTAYANIVLHKALLLPRTKRSLTEIKFLL